MPYYAALWLWTFGGGLTDDAWLRSLSLVSVVATAVLTTVLARKLGGVKVAYLTGVLFALNPGVHFAAHDARPYALGLLIFVLAAVALLTAVDSGRPWRWISFSALLLVGTTVMPNGLVLLIPLLFVLHSDHPNLLRSRALWLSLVPTAVVVITSVSLLVGGSFSAMREWLPSPQILWAPTGVIWAVIGESESVGAPHGFAAALLVLSALTVLGRRILLGSLIVVLVVWVFSQGPSSFWIGRAFITLIPLLTLAAALGLAKLSRKGLIAGLVVIVILAIPGYTAVRLPREGYADMRLAAQIIEQEAAETDQIFGYGYLGQGLQYELAGGLSQYASQAPTWEVTREPTRPFWILYGDYPCEEIFSAEVRGQMSVRRCAAP